MSGSFEQICYNHTTKDLNFGNLSDHIFLPKLKNMKVKAHIKVAAPGFAGLLFSCRRIIKKTTAKSIFILTLFLLLCSSASSFAQDATGASTGTIKDLGIDSV